MRLSFNLRGDLAKLSDDELAQRLETAWQALEVSGANGKEHWRWSPWSRRGPLRHPRIYRFLSILPSIELHPLVALLLAAILSSKNFEGLYVQKGSYLDQHLDLCEIQDIMDEIKRRLAHRKGTKS